MARQSLQSWLTEAMTDQDKDGKITAIELVHVHEQGERPIHAIRFGAGKVWTETELADLFKHKAEAFCQDIPGSQLFCLNAFYGVSKEVQARHPFRVSPSTEIGGLGTLTTEAPNETGVRQQSMRLTEALIQGAFRERALFVENLLRSNEILTRHNHSLMSEQHSMTESMRTLIIQQAMQNHEFEMKKISAERVTKMLDLAPAVINQITGKTVVPKETEDTAILKTIAGLLTEEQVRGIAAVLPPEVMATLAKRLIEFRQEAEEKEDEGKRRLKLVSPEEDAAGGKNG